MAMIVRTLPCIMVFLWVFGVIFSLFLGIGIRYGVWGWRKYLYMPGEEVILLTGQNHGVFCEKVMLQSSGYLVAKHLRILDWTSFKNPETRSEHFDVSLADKYYDFKKYRLYPGEALDVRVCSERGVMVYTASTTSAFVKLKSDLEKGNPCQERPPAEDPICGKVIEAVSVPAAGKKCDWLEAGLNFNTARINLGWRQSLFSATAATDVFVVLSSNNMENRGRNLLDIQSHKFTYLGGTTEVIAECTQQQQCLFAMDFGSSQAVVVQVGTVNEEPTHPVEIWAVCKARDWFFVLLFCIIPIVLLSAISFCVARRYTANHRLNYVPATRI